MFNRHFHNRRHVLMQQDNRGGGRGFDGFDKMFASAQGRNRFFKKGNLQLSILSLLEEEPKHGYQVIKDLEARFKGFYSPSPGSVYPILQMLEDREFVSVSKEGTKKVYTVTAKGSEFLKEHSQHNEFTKRMEAFKNMDMEKMNDLRNQIQDLFKEFMVTGQSALKDENKYDQFQQLIKDTKAQLLNMREEK